MELVCADDTDDELESIVALLDSVASVEELELTAGILDSLNELLDSTISLEEAASLLKFVWLEL